MDDVIKVGGEVEAYCTTCKIMKPHVVVAMVESRPAKVECHGCGKQHVYRAAPPGAPRARSTNPRARHEPITPPPDELGAKLTELEPRARPYSPKEHYQIADGVRHPSFGVGLVLSTPGPQRIEVAFRSGRKLLVHRQGEPAPASTLAPPQRNRDDRSTNYVTDAPPDKAPRR